jgi:Na+-translocating ferredoxin:NAD+ oxidoreductase RnfC subunit
MGDEINLIYESTGRVVKPGCLPITSGVIVLNGETVYNIYQAATSNAPVTEKWVTIGGDLADRYVVRVPVGMKVSELFKNLGVTVKYGYSVIDGGPSMGRIINVGRAVITKTTKSLLIIPDTKRCIQNKNVAMDDMLRRAASACCGCVRCTEMCPRHLLGYPLEPHKMIRAALNQAIVDYPELVKTASLCCSCGVCAEVCCQEISPKDVILHLKGILAKNKERFVAGDEQYNVNGDRSYRMISSVRWEEMLGVHKYDVVPRYVQKPIAASRVEILMSQHIGAPSVPAVSVGDKVDAGQLIASCGAGLSVAQHASISGTVTAVDATKIVIEA